MPKQQKEKKKRNEPKIYSFYIVKDNKLIRKNKFCPRCGAGVFLAMHKDRHSCGKCGYTEYLEVGTK